MERTNLSIKDGYGIDSLSLRDILAIVFRHRRLIGLTFFGIVSGAILIAILQPSQYEGEMRILVKRDRIVPIVTPEATTLPQVSTEVTEAELNSEVEFLKSRELLEKTVLACDLMHRTSSPWADILPSLSAHTGFQPSEEASQIVNAVRALQKHLKVEVVRKTNLIAVNYNSLDPKLAQRVLSTLASLYLEKHVTVHRPAGAFDFFQKESEKYRQGLTAAEARLVNFNNGGSVVSAQLEKPVALQKLAEFDAMLRQTQAAIAETQQRILILEEQEASIPTRLTTQVRRSDDGTLLSQLKSNLLTLEQRRTELLVNFTPNYRPVKEVEAQIMQTRAALASAEKSQLHEETTDRDPTYEWVRGELTKAKADLVGLRARAKATALSVQSYHQIARSLETTEIIQGDLLRTIKAAEDNYLLYRRKEEEARISDALDRGRILNVAIAEAPAVPLQAANHRSLTVLFGILLATFVTAGLVFASEYLASTFRTPTEVESFLNIPVLASMPRDWMTGSILSAAAGRDGENGVRLKFAIKEPS